MLFFRTKENRFLLLVQYNITLHVPLEFPCLKRRSGKPRSAEIIETDNKQQGSLHGEVLKSQPSQYLNIVLYLGINNL